ncbi:carboxymuconolactone decarboxylase family protein [Frankia sp. CNm7]|uniref:Alkyl hydroperoxide reductase AhpD n=1 Tax=Frankia nepalensis TaxID=1836974 RepID=A0A937RJS9_9ACTN|nr:carboxymuconolactone decarboxylase family protein [Frankia nepalensis]MBL7496451.1 carboxymuconolactone decarboxylase family protein [Frankia nepalensis]MBL7510812.1 carboxymuconolactone decarboxylase family protein [Frankia nepalensis]MBL7523656.1 carboxymuconolactone decarboxylase family protein [Frankia nepalensis]MBL7631610.1 carboxymuconolactone decarboxylase family protein [Frankia nepalensis]
MSVEALRAALPEYAKDLRLNLGSVTSQSHLTEQQLWGTVLTAALASRGRAAIAELEPEARAHLSAQAYRAAKTAAALMAMNNIYYRSLHLLEDAEYDRMRAGLRMNAIANPGVEKVDFELWSLAASAVNGCGRCLQAHEHELRGREVSREVIQDAIRIASVVHAVAVTLESEELIPATV